MKKQFYFLFLLWSCIPILGLFSQVQYYPYDIVKEGDTLWFTAGTNPSGFNGLMKYNLVSENFDFVNGDYPKHMGNIAIDNNGNKWIGTDEGLAQFDGKNWEIFNKENTSLPGNYFQESQLLVNGNDIWITSSRGFTFQSNSPDTSYIGNLSTGLIKFNAKNFTFFNMNNSGLPSNKIYSIAKDSSGNIWLGTNKGLVSYDGTNWTVYNTSNSPILYNGTGAISVDKTGKIWFAQGDAVISFDGNNFSTFNIDEPSGYSFNSIHEIVFDSKNNLWAVCEDGDGLLKFDGVNWSGYNKYNSNLNLEVLRPICIDDNDILWLGGYTLVKYDGIDFTELPNYDFNNGLIANYSFVRSAWDVSGNGHDGNLFGGTSWVKDRCNDYSSAINFKGIDGRVEIPHSDEFNLNENDTLAISLWFSLASHVQYAGLICKGNNISNYCITDNSDGKISANLNHYSINNSQSVYTSKAIPLNEWHHIVAIYTPAKIMLYLDGQLDNQMIVNNTPIINSEPLYLGVDADGQWEFLKGALDDIRIYNRSLNSNEIFALFNETANYRKSIISPKDGDQLPFRSNPIIKFTPFVNNTNVIIDYSVDGGQTWTKIAENIANNGMYENWIVPNTPSTNCKIRISDPKYDDFIISDGYFSIVSMDFKKELIAYYPFNKNVKDQSGRGHDGILFSGTNWVDDRFNNANSAIHFNGIDGRVEIPHSEDLNLNDNDTLSFSFWFFIEKHVQYGGLLCKGNKISNYCSSDNSNGTIAVDINHYASNTQEVVTSKNIPINEWHHLAAVFTPQEIKIYLDGKFDNKVSIKKTHIINSEPLYFGVDADGQWEYLKGKLDDIRIYKKALSNLEINALYNEIVEPISKDIVYEITLPNCETLENPLLIEKGTFAEGDRMKFPEYQLPQQYNFFQPYYNCLANSIFGIPRGSLNENIKINISFEGICEHGLIDNPTTQDIIELLFLNTKIIGENSGIHNPFEYYYFKDGNEAYLKIPLENINPLIELFNFNKDLLVPFFTKNGLNPDFSDIRKEVDSVYYTVYTKHLSELKLGIIKQPTDVKEHNNLPTEYMLEQNYPNPFNPTTLISYSLPTECFVTLNIYDLLGREMAVLENGYKLAGTYSYNFDASNFTSGIYFYTIKAGSFTSTKKMLLMK